MQTVEANAVTNGTFGTCCTMFMGKATFLRMGGGGGGKGGGSLNVCSVTLKYAKIGCQKSLSTEAAEVA